MPLIVTENGLGAYDKLEEGDVIKDLKRIKKKSFYWYKDVIMSNGEELK